MIKRIALIFFTFGILSSCSNDDDSGTNSGLIGNWRLKENIIFEGDGGEPTVIIFESEKILTFHNDGIISSNGNLCNGAPNIGNPTSGTYSEIDSTFNSNNCSDPSYNYTFTRNVDTLLISFPCIEPCLAKYLKE